MAEPGFAVQFNVDPQGSELDQAALATDTVLFVGDASDYDPGDTVQIDNGTTTSTLGVVATDVDAGTVTLTAALGIAADVGDRVYILSGDEIAFDHSLDVQTSDGESVEIPVDYADRILWAEGPIDPPVPVLVSDDLTEIVDVPGRRALVNPSSFEVPLFVGFLSSNLSFPTGATYSTVTGWTPKVVRGGMVYDAATSSVVVPLPGWYSVSDSAVAWAFNATGRRAVQPAFNTAAGVVVGAEFKQDASPDPVQQTTPVSNPLTPLEAGETAYLTAVQTSGASLNLQGNAGGTLSFFCVEYRGPL